MNSSSSRPPNTPKSNNSNRPHSPPLPHSLSHRPIHEEPDPSPNYRRAYLIDDPNSNFLTREECLMYIQNLEKVTFFHLPIYFICSFILHYLTLFTRN